MKESFYRLMGIATTLFGLWILYVNLADISYSSWVLAWILSAGLAGAAGGGLFLLSFDGPSRFRVRRWRLLGWLGMLYCAVLPWSFQFLMLPLVLLTVPSLNSHLNPTVPAATPNPQ